MNANDETANVFITSLDDYQAAAMRTAALGSPHEQLLTAALGLAGEAGEAAEIVKKWYAHGHDLDDVALRKELGDVMWYLALYGNALSMALSEIASANIAKLRARYPQGFSTAESLKRCECGHHLDDHAPDGPGDPFCSQCDRCEHYIQRTVA